MPAQHLPTSLPPTTLVPPAAERVFSLLKLYFGDDRSSSLSDLVEGSLVLKYNGTKRALEKATIAKFP